jgi:hypothetical protein
MLLELGRVIVSEMDMDDAFSTSLWIEPADSWAPRNARFFIFDPEKNELWSRVSTDLETNEIRFPAHTGSPAGSFKTGNQ